MKTSLHSLSTLPQVLSTQITDVAINCGKLSTGDVMNLTKNVVKVAVEK